MPSGDTFVTTVEEGLNTMVASARTTQEFPADIMPRVVDRQSLTPGTGTAWREFLAAQLTAQSYGESDTIDNPQELDGSILSATPQLVAIQTFIGRRVAERLSPIAFATFGQLAMEAMQRRLDTDGLALFATATTTLAGATTTLTSGHALAALRRITSNAVETPGAGWPLALVLHGIAIHDLQSEILSGVGTYPIPEGMTQEVYRNGFRGMLGDGNVYEDGNIAITATPSVRGAAFSKRGLLLVQGMSPWQEMREEPQKGYGGMSVWLKSEYVYAERSAGNWLYGLLADGTQPTS